MSEKRFKENEENRLSISTPTNGDPTLVYCPKCRSKAVITLHNDEARLSCPSCGYHQAKLAERRTFHWSAENPTDSYFGANLLLQTDCSGKSLWAFNNRHLEYLEDFVSAKHRQRNPSSDTWMNSSLASRLPKWLKAAKNREQVLKAIAVLKNKI
ncbi:hypothetical protein ACTXJ5_07760 [Psychrobacter alimentarius]|uniref:hypothetical protein n=1 Tax=Psychrobacter alimentarius TaxID=261164 RepID=UPI003FD33FC0